MTPDDLDQRLAQEVADNDLEYAARQFITVQALVRLGDSDQAQLGTARRRLQEAAQAWCQAHGHADLC